MNENENLVPVEGAENTGATPVEEPVAEPKTYTEAEFNAKLDEVLGKKIARREAKIRKEYEKKYGDLESTVLTGMGKNSVEEATNDLKAFYRAKGIDIPDKPNYSARDIEVLARAEADDIISGGYDEVCEEVDRLAAMGAANMTARDKAVFKALAEYRQNTERGNELAKIGVTEDVYNSKEFREFASKFNSNTPIQDVYDIYAKTLPKKEIRAPGSMKNEHSESGVKEYYSPEEAKKFSQAEINNNPALFAAIERSMQKWK